MQSSGSAVIKRLHDAMNRHDLETFLDCFDPEYQSEQPAHPNRSFRGREQVRRNWTSIFTAVADLRSELLTTTDQDGVSWTEWRWYGHQADANPFDVRGVTLLGIENDRIRWGRLYMEEVEAAGVGIDDAVRQMSGDGLSKP